METLRKYRIESCDKLPYADVIVHAHSCERAVERAAALLHVPANALFAVRYYDTPPADAWVVDAA